MLNQIREHTDTSPALSAGDLDAAWQDADSGEELAGGSAPTPDQNSIEAIGEALGVVYREGEILHTEEKLSERDEHRWELDPASSEDFAEREAARHGLATPPARTALKRTASPQPAARRRRSR